MARFDDAMVLSALCVATVVLTLGSVVIVRTYERVARERGLIDQTTGS